jgi:hypothetical protein
LSQQSGFRELRVQAHRRSCAIFARATIVGVAVLVVLGATAVPGASARESVASGVVIEGYEIVEDDYVVRGSVTSDKAKCRGKRKMEMLISYGVGLAPADTGRSRTNGAWALQYPVGPIGGGDPYSFRVKALKKRLPNGDLCQKAGAYILFD